MAGLLDDVVLLLVRLDVASLIVRLENEVDGVLDDDAFNEDDAGTDGLEDEVLLFEGLDLDFSDPSVVLIFFSLSLIVLQHQKHNYN